MISEETSVIDVLSRDFDSQLTINQISKEIGKSYAYTNKYVRGMMARGILNRKIVGSAILCSVNYENEETIAYLVFASTYRKIKFFEKLSKEKKEALARLSDSFDNPLVYSVYLENNSIIIVCDDKKSIGGKGTGYPVKWKTRDEFSLTIRKTDFSHLIVLRNHELFWKLVGRMA